MIENKGVINCLRIGVNFKISKNIYWEKNIQTEQWVVTNCRVKIAGDMN